MEYEKISSVPAIYYKYPTVEVSRNILDLELDTWLKISGFQNLDHLIRTRQNMWSGERSLTRRLARSGITLKTKVDKNQLILYVVKRRRTKRAVDEGDSAPLQAESIPEHLSIEEADTTPALRN